MSVLEEVAIRLAQRVAPDEVELAPAVAEAAAADDAEWRRLQQPAGAMHGGVIPGAEMLGDISLVIGAVKDCASVLTNIFVISSASITILLSRSALRDKISSLAKPDNGTVERTVEAVMRELARRGVPMDRAERVADQVLVTLAEKPAEGRQFVETLQAR